MLVLALTAGACGRSADDAPAAAPPAQGTAKKGPATASIKDFAFAPAKTTVAPGTEITWTNADSAPHTVTANDKSFDSGSLAKDATFVRKFDTAGTFEYFCTIHDYMKATVTVE